jgi:CO/xanthine dehydrogenase FAD-binding subunit
MFYQPHTLEEALALKARLGPDAAFLAGGTDLIVVMNHGRTPAKSFIDLTHVPGRQEITLCDGRYVVSGGTSFAALARLPVKCLAEAALSVGGPQIRNRASVAGNLATASPAGDGSTALLALDADLTLRDLSGTRSVPIRDFFLDYRKTLLRPDEIIESVSFPADWRTSWYKLGKRGAVNISLVCCAVGLSLEGRMHVAFGSVGPYPMRTPGVEEYLTARIRSAGTSYQLSQDDAEAACKMAAEEVRPIDDYRGSAEYRRAMSGALLRKCLRQVVDIR